MELFCQGVGTVHVRACWTPPETFKPLKHLAVALQKLVNAHSVPQSSVSAAHKKIHMTFDTQADLQEQKIITKIEEQIKACSLSSSEL